MKQTIILIGYIIICITGLVGCGNQSDSSASQSTPPSNFKEELSSSDSYSTIVEATFTLASYVRSEAAFYKWDSNTPNILYGIIQDDNGFGTNILNEYPQLKNMEYIIIFSGKRPDTLFLHQPQEGFESIGVSGNVKSIEDLNVHNWNELLSYYGIQK